MSRGPKRLTFWVILLAMVTFASICRAQHDYIISQRYGTDRSDYHLRVPHLPVSEVLIERISEILDLSDAQRSLITDLRTNYDAQCLEIWVHTTEKMTDLQSASREHQEYRRILSETLSTNRSRMIRVRDAFFSDLQLALTKEQAERWSDVEREIRRLETLAIHSTIPDETYDLSIIARSIVPPDQRSAELVEILDQYSLAIDRPLVARNRLVDEARSIWNRYQERDDSGQSIQNISGQTEALDSLYQIGLRVKEQSESIVRVNRDYRRRIADLLTDEQLDRFLAATTSDQSQPHRQIPSVTKASRALHVIQLMTDRMRQGGFSPQVFHGAQYATPAPEPFTEEQREQLTTLVQELTTDIADLLVRYRHEVAPLMELQRGHIGFDSGMQNPINFGEFTVSIEDQEMREQRQSPTPRNPEESLTLFNELRKLDQRYIDRLREILTIRQRAHIANY